MWERRRDFIGCKDPYTCYKGVKTRPEAVNSKARRDGRSRNTTWEGSCLMRSPGARPVRLLCKAFLYVLNILPPPKSKAQIQDEEGEIPIMC